MQICRWHSIPDETILQHAILQRIVSCAVTALTLHGAFHLVLAGGRTPQALYAQLRTITTDWMLWSIYFGDERCLPLGDPQRNDTTAYNAWLDHVPIPRAQIFSIPAQLGSAIGAAQYNATLAQIDMFDLVLLGLGEDGHTASLFPGHRAELQATSAAVAVTGAPKLPAERVSMSAARLSRARDVIFIATGSDKHAALQRWRQGEPIPASLITPHTGVDIYTNNILAD